MTTTSEGIETASNPLSDLEIARARNVERNNARLRELGLISRAEELQSNAFAWQRRSEDSKARSNSTNKKRTRVTPAPSTSSRKSLRAQGLQPDGSLLPVKCPSSLADFQAERSNCVKECREVRQRLALQYAELGFKKAAQENPTATYEHCLMRVRTMTDKALATRVKVIERAAGKHSVVKMAIFKSCLQDEGKWELAELSSEALERLKAMQPPPEVEE